MFKNFLFIIPFIINNLMAQDFNFADRLYDNYQNYKEESLTTKRFKHSDIVPLINKLKDKNIFTVKKAGTSAEGRDIFLITAGTGNKKVFLWSQMHGDESTATMAIFDVFNFLNSNDDFNKIKKDFLKKLTIYFMPMVNPDGAEVFERRNDYDIDINRDAIRQQTPEGRILRRTYEKIKPDFCFNLHDQNSRYSVGKSGNIAALSFLAPAVNYEKTVNTVRGRAIKLISEIFTIMNKYVPGHIAKYPDDFEPRAFGDNFQKWGASTILIESGGWKEDPEKQFLRKLNFIAFLSSFKSIADESYKKQKQSVYDDIPFNKEFIMNAVLRNLEYNRDGKSYKIDIGINLNEININDSKDFYYISHIEDLGDLSTYYGNNDFDFSGYTVEPGKIYEKVFNSTDEIKNLDFNSIYKQGYTDVLLNSDNYNKEYTPLPVNIHLKNSSEDYKKIKLGIPANLIIKKNNEIKYVVVNGFIYDVDNPKEKILNGLVFQ
jgi:Zinc carboxypeptidase